MKVGRREFLKFCIGSAATLGLEASVVGRLSKALAAGGNGLPTVVWLSGASCTGCTVSLANLVGTSAPTNIADLLINTIGLAYHPNLMGAAGDLAVSTLEEATTQPYVLAVEGGVPTAFNGHACLLWTEKNAGGQLHEVTAMEAVQRFAPGALAVLSIGTCSSFGGIPSGNPNPTGVRSVAQLSGVPTVNIPGCPPHPNWIVATIAQFLAGAPLSLDSNGRPTFLFQGESHNVHKNCPRRGSEEAKTFAQGGCLKELGCKGPRTQADCPKHLWNNGTNWCIGANAVCLGCSENGFPDKFSPFYRIPSDSVGSLIFEFKKAEWRQDNTELRLEGNSTPGSDVKLFDANSGEYLGSATTPSDGKWKLWLNDPLPVPCRARAESEGQSFERAVKDAPSDCGSTGPGVVQFEFNKAEWRQDNRELRLEGIATPGMTVQLFHANPGDYLGSATAASDGRWNLRLYDPSSVPCSVTADCGGESLEMSVKDAPSDCGSSPPSATLVVKSAKWESGDRELRLQGLGDSGATVVVYNAATGDRIDSTRVRSDGEWRIKASVESSVPCSVIVESGGATVEKQVKEAPRNCV